MANKVFTFRILSADLKSKNKNEKYLLIIYNAYHHT